MTSKELLDRLHEMKIPAKSHASMLADAYVEKIRKNLEPEIKARAGQLEDEEAAALAAEQAEEARRKAEEEAARRAAIDCALEALFAEKGWEVTEEDIEALFAAEEDPAAARAKWQEANRMADVRKMCRREKATRWLVDNAEVTVVEDGAVAAA